MAEAKKRGFFSKIKRYIKDVVGELKKVVWPSKSQSLNNTFVVVVFCIIMALVIFGFDAGIGKLLELVFMGKA